MNPDHPVRVKVACINWREPDAPHALAYTVNAAGEHLQSRGFPTWPDAMAFADRLARYDPPLRCEGESGQHLSDLADIRADIAARAALVEIHKLDGWIDRGHHFRNNSARFLAAHPRCRIGIRDEYDVEHPITQEES